MTTPIEAPDQARLKADAKALNDLMDETTHVHMTWTDKDFGPMLEQQLNAQLKDDLGQLIPSANDTLAGTPFQTFRELLLHPNPPVIDLMLIKEFAKQLLRDPQYAYPEPVATMLYYASLAAAETHAQKAITHLPRIELNKGYTWALTQGWLPDDLRQLFLAASTIQTN